MLIHKKILIHLGEYDGIFLKTDAYRLQALIGKADTCIGATYIIFGLRITILKDNIQ
jgi:hypothetical protein